MFVKSTQNLELPENTVTCIQDGLGDAYEILFGSESVFNSEMIVNSQLYPQYKCSPVKDEGKIVT